MEDEDFNRLAESVQQAKDIIEGKLAPNRIRVRNPQNLAKSAREKLDMTQEEFAKTLNTSISTVRSWEQGTRTPTPATEILLKIATKYPEKVLECV